MLKIIWNNLTYFCGILLFINPFPEGPEFADFVAWAYFKERSNPFGMLSDQSDRENGTLLYLDTTSVAVVFKIKCPYPSNLQPGIGLQRHIIQAIRITLSLEVTLLTICCVKDKSIKVNMVFNTKYFT